VKKKIISLFILTSMLFQSIAIADDNSKFEQQTIDGTMTDSSLQEENKDASKEKFLLDVGMMNQKQIDALNQKFTKLDLKKYVNRNVKDDVEGDKQGGWSDQGENDLRQFNSFGDQEMLGVPFYFINPEENNGNAVLGLRGQNDTGIPTSVTIPVNKVTAGAYFIQASPFCSGTCGTYTWVYEDGSESYMDIVQDEHICDFWGTASYDFVRPAWTVTKPDGSLRSLYLFAMNNPYPEKTVKELRLETDGGGAYIMILAITLTDKGPYLTKTDSAESITTTTYGWYEYEQPDEEMLKGSILDFSYLLDAPAGKHGGITTDGESLKFADGENASFWGTEIIGKACFPEKEKAEEVALKIARSGYNLVKFSGFDEELLKNTDKTELDEDKLDKLAYFMSKLKEKGIYSYFSFLSDRVLRKNDSIENYSDFSEGYGIDAFFDDGLIKLQKEFISDFLGYVNPYTKEAIGDDKSVVMAELVSEISLFDFHNGHGREAFANKVQYEKANIKFNVFLSKKYGSTEKLNKFWTSEYDKYESETIEEKNISLKACFDNPLASEGVKNDVAEFLCTVLDDYYKEMKDAVSSENILVTLNSNVPDNTTLLDLSQNAKTDFVTRIFYNANPYSRDDKISMDSTFNQYGSMTKTYQNTILNFANNAPYKKPYIAHWGSAQPNLYFTEGAIMMAAFSGQKNWTAIEHSFANEVYSDKNYIDDFYSAYNNPVRLALSPVAASIYYTGEKAKEEIIRVNNSNLGKLFANSSEFGDSSLFAKNTRLEFCENTNVKKLKTTTKTMKTDKIYQNTEIGLFEVRGDVTEALSGFLTEKEEMPTFSIETDNSFVTAALTSVDGKSIKTSDRYLFTAVGSTQNFKSRVNLLRNRYEALGEEKIVVEAITGNVTIKQKGNFSVYTLSSSGERQNEIAVSYDKNGYPSFELLSSNRAIQYEIIKTGEKDK